MKKQNTRYGLVSWLVLVLIGAQLLVGCAPRYSVGDLQTESQSVELGDADSVRAVINFGAGDLSVSGDAEDLLEADFLYNVEELQPVVTYKKGTLTVKQPDSKGLPSLFRITEFRNQWDLHLNNAVPMDLTVNVGGGSSNLQLADLSLTDLDITVGAGTSTIDLSGDWQDDLDVTVDVGGAFTTLVLPADTGVHVTIDAGPTIVEAPEFTKKGTVYTNAAFGESDVTLHISVSAGIGTLYLEEAAVAARSN